MHVLELALDIQIEFEPVLTESRMALSKFDKASFECIKGELTRKGGWASGPAIYNYAALAKIPMCVCAWVSLGSADSRKRETCKMKVCLCRFAHVHMDPEEFPRGYQFDAESSTVSCLCVAWR